MPLRPIESIAEIESLTTSYLSPLLPKEPSKGVGWASDSSFSAFRAKVKITLEVILMQMSVVILHMNQEHQGAGWNRITRLAQRNKEKEVEKQKIQQHRKIAH